MISKIKSKKRTIIKALFILPVAALLVIIFSFTRGTEPNDLTGNFTEKELNNTQLIITQEQDSTIPEDEIFFIVEEMPSFMGKGLDGFREDWVMKQLKYPEIAAKKGIEGDVYVQFVVDKKGNVKKAVIMRGVDSLLDAEALRVVKSSPAWMPGKQRGQAVNVAFTFPMKFVLQEPEKTEPEEKVIPVEKKKQEKPVVEEEISEGEEIFFIVEEMPTFNGEELNGFREWVMKQLEYPEIAAKKGIEGDVYVQFVVDKKGNVKKAVIMRGVDSLLDAEALRVVKSSPPWIPGKQRGQVVNVAFTFPIKFVTQ